MIPALTPHLVMANGGAFRNFLLAVPEAPCDLDSEPSGQPPYFFVQHVFRGGDLDSLI